MRHVLSFIGKNTTSKTLIKSEKLGFLMSNESQQGTAKGIEGAVGYCASCGVEFTERLRSAEKISCGNCDFEFTVRVIKTAE